MIVMTSIFLAILNTPGLTGYALLSWIKSTTAQRWAKDIQINIDLTYCISFDVSAIILTTWD
jgi:hypothetical protein